MRNCLTFGTFGRQELLSTGFGFLQIHGSFPVWSTQGDDNYLILLFGFWMKWIIVGLSYNRRDLKATLMYNCIGGDSKAAFLDTVNDPKITVSAICIKCIMLEMIIISFISFMNCTNRINE